MQMMNAKTELSMFTRLALRRAGLAILVLTLAAGLIASPVFAQDTVRRQLVVGDVVTGTLNSETFIQVYTVSASAGDTLTIDVSTNVDDLAPVVIVTDERGNVVASDVDTSSPGTAALADINIPSTGTYYIAVMRGSGAEGDAGGQFTLRLSGIQQVGGQMVTLENGGLLFELTWNAAVNFNLEVRDPVGGTVHAFSPGSPSGGTLDADVNGTCEGAIADSPTETIAWPAGDVPAGSYEIIIYYLDTCDVGGPQVFTVSASANGEEAESITGTLNPGQEYVARLELAPDASWSLVNGGVNAGLDFTIFSNLLGQAEPIAIGSTVSGLITNAVPARAYTFEGTAGATVDIIVNAQSGSLDTSVALFGPNNNVLGSNEDASPETTDSALQVVLPADGTYTVIVSRYALSIGGTEGDYSLRVTQSSGVTPPVVSEETGLDLDLPAGAIEVTLTWNTVADLQLLIRDPNGEAVYDDFPQVRSGGILAADGNVGCLEPTTTPVSYIYWPPNRLLPGTYEIEVWYQNPCGDTTPVSFDLTAVVLEQTIVNTQQQIAPDSRFMITFEVGPDGTATAGPGGFFNMTNASSLSYQTRLDSAIPISYGSSVSGSITDQQRYLLYSFQAQQGDVVSIAMNATGGTLDPALYLISPDGIQIAFNDDVAPGENRNSAIENQTLAFTGTYYIIATHYGLQVGGTQGTFTLDLVLE